MLFITFFNLLFANNDTVSGGISALHFAHLRFNMILNSGVLLSRVKHVQTPPSWGFAQHYKNPSDIL